MVNNSERVRKRQRETKERIFNAAMALFREKGYANTTVSEITDAADIGKGTFFTYFPTKEAVVDYHEELLYNAAADAIHRGMAEGRSFRDIIREAIRIMAQWHDDNRGLYDAMPSVRSLYAPDDETGIHTILHGLAASLTALVQRAQSTGELRSGQRVDDVVTVLVGVTLGVSYAWFHGGREGRSLQSMLEGAFELVLNGIS